MNWRLWAKRLLHYLPLWGFGLGLLIPVVYAGTEFCLAHAGKPKLLYDWQEIDIGFIFGTVMLSSFALSFVWSILIHRFWRKEERQVRWTASCLFFAFPFIVCLILTNFPIHLAFLPKTKLKEKSHRIWCWANLKQIYIDLTQYANDNNGYYPDDLEKFVESCGLHESSRCPAAAWKRWFEQGRKRDLEHGRGEPFLSDYNYYGKGRKETDAPFVILEDKIDNHRGNYKNFLRSDGWIGSARKIE